MYRNYYFILCLLSLALGSCQKYLDKKPRKALVIPTTLEEVESLLNNENAINMRYSAQLEANADNYYVSTEAYLAATDLDRPVYVWGAQANTLSTWKLYYQFPVLYANLVLENLDRIGFTAANRTEWDRLKGSALFHRSFSFWDLAQLYCHPYDAATLAGPGIVLKTTTGIEETSVRSTVQQTYDQLVNDLKTAIPLLPPRTDVLIRPTRFTAYGALARVYLSMRDYVNAGLYADSCLQDQSALMDFNTLVPVGTPPIKRFNRETIFYARGFFTPAIVYPSAAKVDSVLYASYDDNDLRKTVFFREAPDGGYFFRGSYDGDFRENIIFAGLAVDELLLIRSECHARAGRLTAAMADLNTLMVNRWKNDGSFVPFEAADPGTALAIILRERRKELLYRNLRWSDLRRLNLEGANITLTRKVDNITYTLPPGDPRWVMLIPQEIINYSGMEQNKR
ncbi:MAG: RagB/SusD family nutrient uptake outer membrane protein [Candidatus Pseudobacter hemicellulosilyticus]|uniref:RagB/SusD family nutrient uptake outer membrane protein n=1 Tax=Candidatus Pseudobacter hemicellulosilyticus TaxID=3121375 RepID=A0AAJ5WMJ1_9BACT|nr:MAG: RagB/SusD family nutrient uptake outer membrane protein [Pseudobacter sp.]